MTATVKPDGEMYVVELDDGVDVAGGSEEMAVELSTVDTGRARLRELAEEWESTRVHSFLSFLIARLLFTVASLPLLFAYSGTQALMAFVAWQVWNLSFFALEASNLRSKTGRALLEQSELEGMASCLSKVDEFMQQEISVHWSSLVASTLLLGVQIPFIALASGVPTALSVASVISFVCGLALVPSTKMFTIAPRIAVKIVGAAADVYVDEIMAHAPLEQLRKEYVELSRLFTSARGAALYGFSELAVLFVSGVALLLPSLISPSDANIAMIVMGSLPLTAMLVFQLPAASTMTTLLDVNKHIAEHYAFDGDGLQANQLMYSIDKMEAGWWLGSVPLSTTSIGKIRIVLVPVLTFALRELLIR
eukprot:PLAT7011.1.p1 GENE.PLAT7011.1~~PLAT7011.1.p1  ORF type:complete len:364 (+),score=93.38 PLAT7011.1:291-1382(+)